MTRLLISLMALVLVCACTPRVVREVYPIPVPYVPDLPVVERPVIDVDTVPTPLDPSKLTDEQKGQLVKSYRLSAESWKQYAIELEQILAGLRDARTEMQPITDSVTESIRLINKDAAEDLERIRSEDQQ